MSYEPNRKITLKTSSGFLSFTGTRLVEADGDSATRVTFVDSGHAGNGWKLAEPVLAALGGRRLRAQLSRLKQVLEAQP